jgi:predicted acyl esterase
LRAHWLVPVILGGIGLCLCSGCPVELAWDVIANTAPADGATDVSRTEPIRIEFAAPVAPVSLRTVFEPKVEHTRVFLAGHRVVELYPREPLPGDMYYTVTVQEGLIVGTEVVVVPLQFHFTTESRPLNVWPPAIAPGRDRLVPMPDGTALRTDIYVPDGPGPWPVALQRTPYNLREEARAAEVAADAARLNAQGVAYVVQNTRGQFGSAGDFDFYASGRDDGADMRTLLAAQSWCDGRVILLGRSGAGIPAYLALPPGAGANPAPLCAWIEASCPDLYGLILPRGMYRVGLVTGWMPLMQRVPFQAEIVAHAMDPEFWAARQIGDAINTVATPTVHITGWYDLFCERQIAAFRAAQAAGVRGQYLIVGPWTHSGYATRSQGGLEFPPNATLDLEALQADFLAHYLSGDDRLSVWPTVRYYVMGDTTRTDAPGNEWRIAADWPPFEPVMQTYHLHSDGRLRPALPTPTDASDRYAYDPALPAPTVGGANLVGLAGPFDQRVLEVREDVLVYSTAPLEAPLEVTGAPRVRLYVTIDQPDTDIIARLCDVYPDGRSMLIAEGALRLQYRGQDGPGDGQPMTPGQTEFIAFELGPTSVIFDQGHQVRLAITSSSVPRYNANRNLGAGAGPLGPLNVVQVEIGRGQSQPSALILPAR